MTIVLILQKRKLRCWEVIQGQVSEVVGSQTSVFPTLNLAFLLQDTVVQSHDSFWLLNLDSLICT